MFFKIIKYLSPSFIPFTITLAVGIFSYANSFILLAILLGSLVLSYIFFFCFDNSNSLQTTSKILNTLSLISILAITQPLVTLIITKMPIINHYSQQEKTEVTNFLSNQVYSLSAQCENFPQTDEELEEILESNLGTTFTIVYAEENGQTKAYIKAFELYKRQIYLADSNAHMVVKGYYLTHEICHLDGVKNEALTSYKACKALINTNNIFLKLCGYNAMYCTMKGNDIDYYDFSKYVCDYFFTEVNNG